ncbi:MAG: Crp/Fnr family transcriptional regulator [Bacillota bacterium]|nr:Crp/Fnr family transcriptional regulator [Bacillota bacterium]
MKINDISLFRNMLPEEVDEALKILAARECKYSKDELILHSGDSTERLGVLLEGCVTIESNDIWGSRTILSQIGPGHVFAEAYAIIPEQSMLVDVVANEDSRVLFLEIGHLLQESIGVRSGVESTRVEATSGWRDKFMRNLVFILAHKNFHLASRNFHTAPRSVRQRIMSYLNSVAIERGKSSFDIPYNRQELADYLNLDRTALSKELGRMRDEGLLKFKKNRFTLLQL